MRHTNVPGSILAVSFVPLKNNFEYDEDEVDDSAEKRIRVVMPGARCSSVGPRRGLSLSPLRGLTAE